MRIQTESGYSVDINLVGEVRRGEWKCRQWNININGEHFEYFTGLGIKGTPKVDELLECLFSDSEAGQESFDNFCDNFGYSADSIKAASTYARCIETKHKLRKALGVHYEKEKERIEKLRDNQ